MERNAARLDALEFQPFEPPPVVEINGDLESSVTRDFLARYLAGLDFIPSPSQVDLLTPPALPTTTVEKNHGDSYAWEYTTATPAKYESFTIPKGISCAQAIKKLLAQVAKDDPTIDATWSSLAE